MSYFRKKQHERLRSSPEMKICEIMAKQEKAAGQHNGAVETGKETGQADI
jgi:hypothetical protein